MIATQDFFHINCTAWSYLVDDLKDITFNSCQSKRDIGIAQLLTDYYLIYYYLLSMWHGPSFQLVGFVFPSAHWNCICVYKLKKNTGKNPIRAGQN